MRISDVSLELFTWAGLDAAQDAAYKQSIGSVKLGLLRIMTDEGIEGNAFLGSSVHSAEMDGASLIRTLKPLLLGRDPMMREAIYHDMFCWQYRRLTSLRCIAAVDIALWDIAGKASGLPIWRLIGGYRTEIPAYASSQVLPDARAYCEEISEYKARGWQAYKIHPPTRCMREDIDICAKARQEAGDGYALMLDSMWSYSYSEAVWAGRALEELNYAFFEDPLPENDLYNYEKLCSKLDIPVMATEYPGGSVDSYVPWLMRHATDILRGDVAVKGGITSILKGARLAEAFDMSFEIHHGANSLNNVANLHVALAIRNCSYFEVMLPDINQKFGLINDLEVNARGLVEAPMAPGLGVEIDMERIRSLTSETLK